MPERNPSRCPQGQVLDTLVIQNPHAGLQDRSAEVEMAAKRLQNFGGRVEVLKTLGPGHATELARDAQRLGFAQIMVAGGDGTFHEAAAGAVNSGLIIGLLPTGSEEIWRREAKIPKDLIKAVDIAVVGNVQRIDTGKINGILFVFDAGIGADGSVVDNVQHPGCAKKDGKGPWRYIQAAGRVLPLYRGIPASLTIDNENFDVSNLYQLWVNNSQNLARIRVRRTQIDDGQFAVTIVSGEKLSKILIPAVSGFVLRRNTNSVTFTVGSNMQVEFSQKRLRKAQGDGDPVPQDYYFDISLDPASLLVRVPDRENELFSRLPLRQELPAA